MEPFSDVLWHEKEEEEKIKAFTELKVKGKFPGLMKY